MDIHPDTGRIMWTPDSTGDFDVTVEAINPVGSQTQTFTINVRNPGYMNIASLGTIIASSAYGSYPAFAVADGVIAGFTSEWATVGEGSGAWIEFTWSAPYAVDRLVLYDRINSDDQVTGATLNFSDGSSISVDTLVNLGCATTFEFSPKIITSIILNIDSVSASTSNIGLAEVEIFGLPE